MRAFILAVFMVGMLASCASTKSNVPFEEKIRARMYQVWDEWKPGYDDWLKWSNTLYAPDATIEAIGGKTQPFKDYQKSMKLYRDSFNMDMGPIETCSIEGNVVHITYKMYMTPKGHDSNATSVIPVTEYNTFNDISGFEHPMVVHLKLITGEVSGGRFVDPLHD
jgi:hypothetical protein